MDNSVTLENADSPAREKRPFTFYKAVYVYLLGGLTGTVWETLLNLFCGNGFVFCNGSLFTPFNFVYGFGAVFIIACLHGQTDIKKTYLIGALGGGIVEYLLSFLEEKMLGTRSWNYEGKLLNINGRTTLIYMAFWGLLCVGVIFLVYIPLNAKLDRLPEKQMKIFATVMAVILIADLTVTVAAIFRYAERNAGQEAVLAAGRVLDRLCNNDFMQLRFPSMKFK